MLKIDQYAYANKLGYVHPVEKFSLALVTMVICLVFSSSVTSLLVILLMAGLVILLAKIPALFYLKLMFIPLVFLVVGVLTVALAFTRDAYSLLWGVKIGGYMFGVTAQGLSVASALFLKSLAAVSCLYFLSLTTPMVEIFSVLKKLRLPPLFIELMFLVYRFIFVLLDTADRIYIAQSSRWGYATWKTSYISLGQLISNLFAKSYYNAQMLFTTLLARGYTGELNVLENTYTFSRKNLLLIVATELALLITGLWSGGLKFFLGGASH